VRLELLVIDPQNDFCVAKGPGGEVGALVVPSAEDDMKRLAAMVGRLQSRIDDIHVTMDSHRIIDIAHPAYWKDSAGNNPAPFTLITAGDVESGRWTTTMPSLYNRALAYVKALETNGRYVLCIWPPHCLIGSWGHALVPEFHNAITLWEKARFKSVDFVTKGSNVFTEHYSAVQAEVPDPKDASTQLNTQLIDVLSNADIVAVAGEALSHCLANTVKDIADNFGEENIKKLVLLTDASSSVSGFEDLGDQFVSSMTARGMQLSTTEEFLK
jgi:nicotinamidase-related amidase